MSESEVEGTEGTEEVTTPAEEAPAEDTDSTSDDVEDNTPGDDNPEGV